MSGSTTPPWSFRSALKSSPATTGVLASHVTVTDPAHDRAREAARALAAGPRPVDTGEVEVRNLAVYDRATGAA